MGIACWVAHKAVWSPQNTAVRFDERTISYAELEHTVARLAGYLTDRRGVAPGDRVAYLGANDPAILTLLFACARLGAIFVPLNARLTASQLAVMVDNADPVYCFAGASFEETARAVWGNRDASSLITVAASTSAEQVVGEPATVESLVESQRAMPCDPTLESNLPVLIAYTSGTTGTPKGAVYTHDALTFTAVNSNLIHNMRGRDHVLTFLPMFHVGGLLIFTLPAIHVGASVTIHRRFDPDAVLDAIANTAVTLMLAPPQFSRALTSHPRFEATDLTSLRCVAVGSTFVPADVMQPWFDRGVPTQQNYGLTECVPVLSSPWEQARRKSHTAGTSVPYTQARVCDAAGRRLEPGVPGEIMLRGRSLFSGYWRNEAATAEAFRDGWFATGDIGFVDDEGYFHIVDRKKHVVIVGSSNVYPADLEKILHEHEAIVEAAVVGIPDAETGEALVACVRLREPHALDAAQIIGLFRDRLADYQHPSHVLFVDDFPRTSLGKIIKSELATLAAHRLGRRR